MWKSSTIEKRKDSKKLFLVDFGFFLGIIIKICSFQTFKLTNSSISNDHK